MIVIYTNRITNRLEYILDFIFNEYLGLNWGFGNKKRKDSDVLIGYGAKNEFCDLFFGAKELLFEENIRDIDRKVAIGFKSYFRVNDGVFTYDPLALSFYILSRYEEYSSFNPDKHGRFSSVQSWMYKAGVLNKPIVEIVIQEIRQKISKINVDLKFKHRKFELFPTFDIDSPYAYKGKSRIKNSLGWLKDNLTLKKGKGQQRLEVLRNKVSDPFDQYDWIEKYLEDIKDVKKGMFFILVNSKGKNNPTISVKKDVQKSLIKRLDKIGEVALHPSYNCGELAQILQEKEDLQNVLGRPIKKSRQHFLKIVFPQSYQLLIKAGIEEDYSMGYHDNIGYRAGISVDFPWFDLSTNEKTKLRIFPFQLMDATYEFYRFIKKSAIEKEVLALKVSAVKNNYRFVFNAHNNYLSDDFSINNWKSLLTRLKETK